MKIEHGDGRAGPTNAPTLMTVIAWPVETVLLAVKVGVSEILAPGFRFLHNGDDCPFVIPIVEPAVCDPAKTQGLTTDR